jgi:HEPN domain-containing protein
MPLDAGSPEAWMQYAQSDLQLAHSGNHPGVLFEALCFHAQQAVEKALKAVLIATQVPAPKTHNIE